MPRQADRPSPLDVSFDNPPVVEVALCVQFRPETVGLEAVAAFASRVRDEFPSLETQPVLPPMVETFDLTPPPPQLWAFHLEPQASLPRFFFESKDRRELIQVQHDRVTLNWRDLWQNKEYPRYVYLRDRFKQVHDELTDILDRSGHEHPATVCEVTYINSIDVGDDRGTDHPPSTRHPDLAAVLNRVSRAPTASFLADPEDAQYQARWRISAQTDAGSGTQPVGRLYVSATPAIEPPSSRPVYLLTLTAHVLPSDQSVTQAMAALDVGHEWVVRGFKDVTTPSMHVKWGARREEEAT